MEELQEYIPSRFMIAPPTAVMQALKKCAGDDRRDPKTQASILIEEALQARGYLESTQPLTALTVRQVIDALKAGVVQAVPDGEADPDQGEE
jgi:hypothetical protein